LGIPTLPVIRRQQTDRNRTSTFAFTGNKFEFRAVGSSQNPSRSNMTLNTILADSVRHLANELEEELKMGKGKDAAIQHVARNTIIKHKDVIWNGNGYSKEWQEEAARRGLPNLRTTPQALRELDKPKSIKLFEDMKVLNEHEVRARKSVFEEDYFKKVLNEAKTLRIIAATQLLPAANRYSVEVATTLAHLKEAKHGARALSVLQDTIEAAYSGLAGVEQILARVDKHHGHVDEGEGNPPEACVFAETRILPALEELRGSLDKLETLVAVDRWPLPTYHQMLFNQD